MPRGKEHPEMAVNLDPTLLAVLACPSEDHAPLVVGTPSDPDAAALTCTHCRRSFRVDDDRVPVLLLAEAFYDPAAKPPS
jgi:uncharacterized protein YbaR (Trm112 family)